MTRQTANDFASLWERCADAVPDRLAVADPHSRLTWSELDSAAARLATALTDRGVRPGSNVGICLFNSVEYVVAQYACFKCRGAPVNLSYHYHAAELAHLIGDADLSLVVVDESKEAAARDAAERAGHHVNIVVSNRHSAPADEFWTAIEQSAPAPRQERSFDDRYLLYTGGTTGLPKGVTYPIGALARRLDAYGRTVYSRAAGRIPEGATEWSERLMGEPHPISVVGPPLMHGTGMWLGTMMPMLFGGTVVLLSDRPFSPDEYWKAVQDEKATVGTLVGDAFAKPLLDALERVEASGSPYDISSLNALVSSGAMWSAETKRALLAKADIKLFDALGSTEGTIGGQVASRDALEETGKFTRNANVKVIGDDGLEVEPGSGRRGRIAAVTIATGYYNDPERTAQTFCEIDGIAHAFTGDWAEVDADGALRLLGRGSLCINTGGEKVFPEEVEEVLKRHTSVRDALVVGLPDERFGERVVAVVSWDVAEPPDPDALVDFARDELARYKCPRQIAVASSVSRLPNGKGDYGWAKGFASEALSAIKEEAQ